MHLCTKLMSALLFAHSLLHLSQASAQATTPLPVSFFGDLRYRHEWVGQEGRPVTSYNQHRLRARFGLKTDLADDTQLEFRLASGPGRTSTNQTLGASSSAGRNYDFGLDRAAFHWRPSETFALHGGRVENLFWLPSGSDLLWDADLNFDGLAFITQVMGENLNGFLMASGFWLDSTTEAGQDDVVQYSGQAGLRYRNGEDYEMTASVAFHHFSNIKGHATLDSASTGNSVDSSTTGGTTTSIYRKEYDLLNPALEISFKLGETPLAIVAEHVTNVAIGELNTGYLAGFKLGKLKNLGDWSLGYDYRKLERDAAVSAFTDADSYGGGTSGRSHKIAFGYQLKPNWSANATYFVGQTGIGPGQQELDRNKLHADLNFKF